MSASFVDRAMRVLEKRDNQYVKSSRGHLPCRTGGLGWSQPGENG